jgi:1-aminocyclopropane-1-carboxylate deaminase/D-cysteine desulfhydrase-like pyridoxal-dependent ACC family enzyme
VEKSIKIFRDIKKESLAVLNTPIDRCHSISEQFDNFPVLYVKRDDFIGNLVWGNKLRKLEYSFAQAKKIGASAVITCGGVQSNHARTTAQVARRLGMKVILVLNGMPLENPTANYLINKTLNVEIHHVNSPEERMTRMDEIASAYKAKGGTIYKIPLGASDDIGSLGFVHAVGELVQQQKELNIEFDYIIHSSSSGGTQAGLEAGKRLFGLSNTKIIGVSADNSVKEIREAIMKTANPLLKRLEMDNELKEDDLNVDTNYIGPGYTIPSEKSLEAAELFAKHEGLLLDQTYTSKAAAAIIDYARKGILTNDHKVLFWHTGGLINLF